MCRLNRNLNTSYIRSYVVHTHTYIWSCIHTKDTGCNRVSRGKYFENCVWAVLLTLKDGGDNEDCCPSCFYKLLAPDFVHRCSLLCNNICFPSQFCCFCSLLASILYPLAILILCHHCKNHHFYVITLLVSLYLFHFVFSAYVSSTEPPFSLWLTGSPMLLPCPFKHCSARIATCLFL